MDVGLHVTSGPALERGGDLAAILSQLGEGDVLFIDEIHRLSRAVEEVLYPAMEDFQLDIVLGKGPAARSIRLDVPRFTLVGATTRTGLITGPLRDRFGLVARLDYYDPADLEAIVERAATHPRGAGRPRRVPRDRPAGPRHARASPTGCCAGSATSPRCGATAPSTTTRPRRAWPSSASTSGASTRSTGPCSARCASASAAGRWGCPTLAIAVGEPTETVEDVYEPFLIREGLLMRTPRGPGGHAGGLGPPRPHRAAGRRPSSPPGLFG